MIRLTTMRQSARPGHTYNGASATQGGEELKDYADSVTTKEAMLILRGFFPEDPFLTN